MAKKRNEGSRKRNWEAVRRAMQIISINPDDLACGARKWARTFSRRMGNVDAVPIRGAHIAQDATRRERGNPSHREAWQDLARYGDKLRGCVEMTAV